MTARGDRRKALAIVGCGLLAVDLYGARALGLIPQLPWTAYAGLSCALVAVINLLMSRLAPKVETLGLAAVVVGLANAGGQLPPPQR